MARQSLPLDTLAVSGLMLSDDPLVPGGPMAPIDWAVCGTFWMLREIELAAAKVGDVVILDDGFAAEWNLPSSKTDVRALGVRRRWECVCVCVAPIHSGTAAQSAPSRGSWTEWQQ